ncbi:MULTISPECIES: hypothetical protein [Streptomyces]|uniref:hypothetical protein n=1 Tax=Streptomyces TaxID=1883 RepID=UPI001A8E40E2|nr:MULTISPECIES: hypothetical protein [Streptomyces]MDW4901362.1 hypothetical protein [Streptomyces californicus]QSS95467.1 hypothetical protein H3V39_33970 [Streptomyces sp. M54]
MSAVAASAAVLDHHGWEVVDNSVDDVPGGGSRRQLRSVPAQAGPVPKRAAGHPLSLGRDARARLGGAVRMLLDAAGLDGASDAVRLAVLVLASRTPSETGVVEIRTSELGRWIGMSRSYTASVVVPALRHSGVVSVETAEGDYGQDAGLKCKVQPLWKAQGVLGHPLRLMKKEYVTLKRLIEAVMGPGWKHRDGRVTPAGLLGTRTGRGAATDRLALLLLVLEARETGRVRLVGGTVDTKRGRPAVTVARLLRCTASAGERVLERLEDLELVLRVRLRTGSGMPNRSRLMVPPVAAAHGRTVAATVQEDRAEALEPEFSDPDVAAGPVPEPGSELESQVSGVLVTDEADIAEPDVAATLHTDHPHLVTPVVDLSLSGGFSGDVRGGSGDLPDHVCKREDQAVDGDTTAAKAGSPVTGDGPLRGEKPKESPFDERVEKRPAGAGAGGYPKAVSGGKAQQQRVGLPADLGLQVALGPVSWLWERLSGWQQDQVAAAAKAEFSLLVGLGVAAERAPRLLAERLTGRLAETGGEALIKKPFGWLIGRGLVRRPSCSDRRCDDGTRLDTGGACGNCGNVVHLRRARRVRTAAEIDRDLPDLGNDERRRVLEERLREHAAAEAQDLVRRQEQAHAEKARRAAVRAADQERAKDERAAAAAAETVRQALACEDCGQQQADGLCEACGYRRRTEALIVEAGMVAATWSADLADQDDVDTVTADVRALLAGDIERARRAFLDSAPSGELDADPIGAAAVLAFGALRAVEAALAEFRSSALGRLGQAEEACAEARRAYQTEQGRRWFRHNPNGADAIAAATKAADTARERTAEYLLATRLKYLREQTAAGTEQAPAVPWTDRLPELAARPLHTDTARAVIA